MTVAGTFHAVLQRAPSRCEPASDRSAIKHRSPHIQRYAALPEPAGEAAVDERAAVAEAVEQHRVHLERQVGDEVYQLVRHVQQLPRREEDVVGGADVADCDAARMGEAESPSETNIRLIVITEHPQFCGGYTNGLSNDI